MKTLETMRDLDSLRPYLGISPINTGSQGPLLTQCGIITDDIECLHAITDEHGRIMLQSGVEFPPFLYRGQTEEYIPCLPTLGRFPSIEEKFLALCRNAAFEEAISEHPFVRICEQAMFLGHPLRVDKQGLAQHYGLTTDMLDLTSNFDVATFFATCSWNHESKNYQPICFSDKRGVIYRIAPALLMSDDIDDSLEIIGWQPLKRPEQQRACVLRLKRRQDFTALPTVQMIKFRQCEQVSIRIWKTFDKGQALFPKDATAELAKKARVLNQFTLQQVNRAWERLDEWNGGSSTADQRKTVGDKTGFSISTKNILTWDGLDVECDETKLSDHLREILNNVRYRMAAYPA